MNKCLTISLVVSTAAFASGISLARDLFDSPGPGYRQQAERVFRTTTKDVSINIQVVTPIIHVEPTSLLTPTLPIPRSPNTLLFAPNDATPAFTSASSLHPFAAPVQLTIDNSNPTLPAAK